jgi:ribosome-interacting GTPase 1
MMPANLPPQYVELEREYRKTKDPEEKLSLLQRMLAEIPKHKGTEHLQGELKQKISKLKKEQKQKKSSARRKDYLDHVPKEGVAQYALVGPPNSGKSSILAAMTNARPEIADFPFTTRKPFPGMAEFESVQMQLVDLPPICTQYCENWVPNVVRTADVAVVVLSLGSDNLIDEFSDTQERLNQSKIYLKNTPLSGDRTPGELYKKTILVANQVDRSGAGDRLEILSDLFASEFPLIAISARDGANIDELRKNMFSILGRIRVYTKTPGHEADLTDPVVLPKGATVSDAAQVIHKDFARQLQFAKIWGRNAFDGQRVRGDYVVTDGDILEFHI